MTALATWFTPELNVFSRSKGASAVASAAYRTCLKLYDKFYGKVQSFGRSSRHVTTELFGDHKLSINDLWDKAEESENRKNSTVARELMIPLPFDWNNEQRIKYCEDVSKMLVDTYKVAGQFSIHKPEKNDNNYHVHIMFTTREVINSEFGKKTRILDEGMKNGEVTKLRERIAELMNRRAEEYGSDFFVTGGKFKVHIPDHIPTINIPHDAAPAKKHALQMENKAILNDRQAIENIDTHLEFLEKSKEALRVAKIEFDQQQLVIEAISKTEDVKKNPELEVEEYKRGFLQEALDYQNKYRITRKAFEDRYKVKETIANIKSEIKTIESVEATISEKVVKFFYGFVSSSLFNINNEIQERRDKIMALKDKLPSLSAKFKNLTEIIELPENASGNLAYKCNPLYREVIKEYEATLPDASKKKKTEVQELEHQKIEPVKTPAPNYSDSPFYIKNTWDSDFKP